MRRSMLTGRNALINLFIAAFVIFIVFNAIRGGDERADPPGTVQRDTSNELRLSKPISASEYVEIDGSPYLLLMAKTYNERIETADLRIISVDPSEDLEQAGWIHTSMSVQRPPEALTYARGHAYVGLAREGSERPALWVVDLSNPNRPYEANLLHADFPIRSLAASEEGFMVASGFDDEFLVYDLQEANEPEVTGRFSAPVATPPDIYLEGSTLIVEHGAGIMFFDMSDPRSPELQADFSLPDWQEPPFQPTPELFLVGDEGFEGALPRQNYLDLAVDGGLIALAASDEGFTLLEPESDAEPFSHSFEEIEGRVASVAIDGESLFVLSGQLQRAPNVRFAVNELDISSPQRPRISGEANSSTITGLPRYQQIIAQDGNVWILFNQNVIRYRTAGN